VTEIVHLTRAPIKEALIDIRTRDGDPTPGWEEMLRAELGQQYPEIQPIKSTVFAFNFTSGTELQTTSNESDAGVRLINLDRLYVAQFRKNGFTFSRLAPYETWESMRDEALRLWEIYVRLMRPINVTRIAVRYINQIDIPIPFNDFGDYLVCDPALPPELPQVLASFLMRYVIPAPNNDMVAIFTQSFEAPSLSHAPVIVDIDCIRDVDLTVEENKCWGFLEELRLFKNSIFFGSITPKARDLYI
jgi:uncharacterized protein (TIGR04255 family)